MNRHSMIKLTVAILLLILLAGSAYALSWNKIFGPDESGISEKLTEIDHKVDQLAENKRVMKFINSNMLDQKVDTVEVSIKEDDAILKTYYIMRGKKNGVAIVTENAPETWGVTWKFYPTVSQSIDGLELAIEGLSIYYKRPRTAVAKSARAIIVLKAYFLYFSVEKEDLPSLDEIIKYSNCSRCKKALAIAGI